MAYSHWSKKELIQRIKELESESANSDEADPHIKSDSDQEPIATAVIDHKGNISEYNEGLLKLFSLENHVQLNGNNLSVFFADIQEFETILKNVHRDHQYEKMVSVLNREGKKFPVFIRAKSADNQSKTHRIQFHFFDIDGYFQQYEDLKRSSRRSRMLYDQCPVIIYEDDISGLWLELETYKKKGITDIVEFLKDKPKTVFEMMSSIKLVSANQKACEMFKVKTESEFIQYFTAERLRQPTHVHISIIKDIYEGKREIHTEIAIHDHAGELRWFDFRMTVMEDTELPHQSNLCVLQDITSAKYNERMKIKVERSLETAQETAHLGSWETDIQTGISYWSNEFYRILGYEPGSIEETTENFKRRIHPEDLVLINDILNGNYIAAQPYQSDIRIRCEDGSIRFVHTTIEVIYNRNDIPVRINGTVLDISERRSAILAMLESEKKYHLLFELISDSIFLHHIDENGTLGRFIEVNQRACKKLGYHKDQLLNMSPYDLNDPKTDFMIQSVIRRLMKEGSAVYEQIFIHEDGTRIPMEIHASLIDYNEEKVVLSIARDITQRKNVEKALYENELKLRNILSSIPMGLHLLRLTKDQLLIFTDYNPAAESILGIDHSMLIGMELEDGLPFTRKTELPARYR